MFKKIFGGSDKPKKEEQPKQVPQANNPIPSHEIEFERVQFQIKQQEDNFEKKIDKYTEKIDLLRNQVKELVKKGQKKQATSKLQEIQQLEQYIHRAENQKQVFLKVRLQLEHGLENKNATDTLSKAAQILKESTDFDKLQDVLGELSEIDQDQKQCDLMFEQQAGLGIDQDGIDEALADIENEIKQEQAMQFQGDLNKIPTANVTAVKQQEKIQPVQQQQQQQQQQKQDAAFNDALLDQLSY